MVATAVDLSSATPTIRPLGEGVDLVDELISGSGELLATGRSPYTTEGKDYYWQNTPCLNMPWVFGGGTVC